MKNIFKLISLLAAIVLSAPLFTIALVFNLFQLRKGKVFVTFYRLFKEVVNIVFDIFLTVAIIIDRLANVIVGDLIERCVTKERDTTFGKNDWTISASLGKLQSEVKLIKFGVKFVRFIDRIFGKFHCRDAYNFRKMKANFEGNATGIS